MCDYNYDYASINWIKQLFKQQQRQQQTFAGKTNNHHDIKKQKTKQQ